MDPALRIRRQCVNVRNETEEVLSFIPWDVCGVSGEVGWFSVGGAGVSFQSCHSSSLSSKASEIAYQDSVAI